MKEKPTEATKMTSLEAAILRMYYERYKKYNFPSPSEISVLSRVNTGSGRYTHLFSSNEIGVPDGQLHVGSFGQFNMDGLPHGASFWLYIKEHRLDQLEIAVNGDEQWDGTEYNWKICNPDTGEF